MLVVENTFSSSLYYFSNEIMIISLDEWGLQMVYRGESLTASLVFLYYQAIVRVKRH